MSPPDQLQNVCANIRYLRAKHGLSRTAMARRLHISMKTLDSIEAGVMPNKCGINLFFYIHREFGITPGRFASTRLENTEDH